MKDGNPDTLAEATNSLTKDGYLESFSAEENAIKAANSKKEYQPEDLKIVKSFRFDGLTNPADETQVFGILANDGTKGTIVMSYSAAHNHNIELIKQIPTAD
ncbi:MAG: hypothetical protein RIA69_02975 [Cyclobacteriaceae bacterium]